MRKTIVYIFMVIAGSLATYAGPTGEVMDSVLVVSREVKRIGSYAYRDRVDIAEVRFEDASELTSIGDYAFLGCSNLRRIILPSGLRTLGEGSFRECGSLESITIPDGVSKLPGYLFYWCENLRDVKLPMWLESIGRSCFAYCRNLREIPRLIGLKNIGMNAFSRCESLREVWLGKRVKSLESYAFSDCVNLRKISFPPNSSELGELILSGCERLEEIEQMSVVPPKFECNSFLFEPDEEELYSRVRVVVPASARGAYRRAHGWRLFKRID
ncbi:MAG: leucine-rich repeat domain-containing protein [Muribaculaceae bacterium]|nr:leucine-rich repeat domain-containing protein [Muribaculaceae bacterium]